MASRTLSTNHIVGVAGIMFVVLSIAGFVLELVSPSPTLADSPDEIRAFFVEDADRVHLNTWVACLAAVFAFLPFATGVRGILDATADGLGRFLAHLSFAGAIVAAALTLAGSAFWEALSFGAAETLPDETLVAVFRIDIVFYQVLVSWGVALFLSAAGIAFLRHPGLPSWLGWFGTVTAVVLLVGTTWIFGADNESAIAILGFLGGLVTVIWVLVTSLLLLRMENPGNSLAPARATT